MILSYITNVRPVLVKKAIQAHAPSAYLLYSTNEDVLTIRQRGKISPLLHLEVDWNEVQNRGETPEAWLGSASL